MKRALISGITGQDGSYLAEFLLDKGYEVHGLVRRASTFNRKRIDHLRFDPDRGPRFFLHYGDLGDSESLSRVVGEVGPDEVYNLAAQSHVGISFEIPTFTGNITGLGAGRMLEATRQLVPEARFYQASSSELYGKAAETPQRETTPFHPRSPYAVAKVYAFWAAVNYREAHGMFACNGILFNHESPRRGKNFVTRKISRGVAKIHVGELDCITLGNLDACRDWGFAGDYVEAMWLLLQAEAAEDYVFGTGETHSVREFASLAFAELDRELVWEGEGVAEVGRERATGEPRVKVDKRYFRPAEVDCLLADSTKARQKLGWRPRVGFEQLVSMMVRADLHDLSKRRDDLRVHA